MRILITIPHYFEPLGRAAGDGRTHGSTALDPRPRLDALAATITALRQLYSPIARTVDIERQTVLPANQSLTTALDIVVCTTQQRHLLGFLDVPLGSLQHHATAAEPLLLGFECQAVLRDCLGMYDFYGFMEDDLIARDPLMFHKLAWFCSTFEDHALLQPNRFEAGPLGPLPKVYLDGRMPAAATAEFQDVRVEEKLSGTVLNVPIAFERARNPHSGCYFLNAEQMKHWTSQPHFLDRDTSFIGPLESAASLGIMRTFRVYKPSAGNAAFLEIEHFGQEFLNLIVAGGGV